MTNIIMHQAHIGEQPPIGTVVITERDVAWQRREGSAWSRAVSASEVIGVGADPYHAAHLTWELLLVVHGQVRELYRPEKPTTLAAPEWDTDDHVNPYAGLSSCAGASRA